MVKPLSANTRSPGIILSRNPDCSVINLSDARPPQAFEIYYIVP